MAEGAMDTDPGARILANAFPEAGTSKIVTVVGIGPRLLARVIDTVAIGMLSIFVAIVAGFVGEFLGMFSENTSSWASFFTAAAGLVFSLVYYIAAWSKEGQTLGDTVVGLRVVTEDGSPPSVGRATVRYLGYLLSAFALSLGFLWIAINPKRQGWHDLMAKTYVIPADQEFTRMDHVRFTPAPGQTGAIWIGAWLVLALFATPLLGAGLWTLGPFIHVLVKTLRGGG